MATEVVTEATAVVTPAEGAAGTTAGGAGADVEREERKTPTTVGLARKVGRGASPRSGGRHSLR